MKNTSKQTRVTTDELLDLREVIFKMQRRAKDLSQVRVRDGLLPIEDKLLEIARHTALSEVESRRALGRRGDG